MTVFFTKKKDIAIIGGGNKAVEESIYLSNIANKVILIHRRDKFRAEKTITNVLLEHSKNKNISLKLNYILKEIKGDNTGVNSMRIQNIQTMKEEIIKVKGVFIAIGYNPNTGFLNNQLTMNNGYIVVKGGIGGNHTQTSIPGIFAAGDVIDYTYRQAITSAGTGCMAALDAEKYIDKLSN